MLPQHQFVKKSFSIIFSAGSQSAKSSLLPLVSLIRIHRDQCSRNTLDLHIVLAVASEIVRAMEVVFVAKVPIDPLLFTRIQGP